MTQQQALVVERQLMGWEDDYVMRPDHSRVDLPAAKAIVAHVWAMAGIPDRPPLVEFNLDHDSAGYVAGAAAYVSHDHMRLCIQVPAPKTTLLLHECAHLLVDDPLAVMELRKPAEHEFHGPVWLTNYLWLLHKLMGPSYNGFYLRSTLPAAVRDWSLPFHPIIRGTPRGDLA